MPDDKTTERKTKKQAIIEKIKTEAYKLKPELNAMSDYIYENPELGFQEFKASEKLTGFLKEHGFDVETGILDMPTAFRAAYDSGKPGPAIGYLCEYDALPDIGHGCGHNIIGTIGVGAGVALSTVINGTGGKIVVFGTPAEETDGAKVAMAEAGVFNELNVAMILHPDSANFESGDSLALNSYKFVFKGKAAHPASSPYDGVNALEAQILFFNGINSYRLHTKKDVSIHGIILEGGVAANIIPDHTSSHFIMRALRKKDLAKVVQRVIEIAQGAALMTGCQLEYGIYEVPFADMITNRTLSEEFTKNMYFAGIDEVLPPNPKLASIDMGDVSQVVPAIHPWLSLGYPDLVLHTKAAARLTTTESAHEQTVKGVIAMALTGYDVLTDPELLLAINTEFRENTGKQIGK